MGDILVRGGSIQGGRIDSLTIDLHGLPQRTIDRATALAWLEDGHSLVPVRGGERLAALQLVEVDDELMIRTDNAAIPEDTLPDLS